MPDTNRAIFLDRDGVLVKDVGLVCAASELEILEGVATALRRLKEADFQLVVVSNQAIVARGMITELQLNEIHAAMNRLLGEQGAPSPDAIYYCPHHPQATLDAYRIACDCRKPRPGMLLRAAAERAIDLAHSYLVGDRMTDILAGQRAGCRSILVTTGQHEAPPIVTADATEESAMPHHICDGLLAATDWILEHESP